VMQTANVAGATALAIDVTPGDHPADLQAFAQSVGQPAASTLQWGIDSTGAIATAYGVQTLETMVVINAQGQIIADSESPIAPTQLISLLRSAS
jgi:translation elongation factor EF-1beta